MGKEVPDDQVWGQTMLRDADDLSRGSTAPPVLRRLNFWASNGTIGPPSPGHDGQNGHDVCWGQARLEACMMPDIVTVDDNHDRPPQLLTIEHPSPKLGTISVRKQAEQFTQRGRRLIPLDFLHPCDVPDTSEEPDDHGPNRLTRHTPAAAAKETYAPISPATRAGRHHPPS